MGFRFRKSIGKGPLRINFSKSGIGYSVGGKGFRYTKKAGGGTRATASIPGTGISYVKDYSAQKRGSSMKKKSSANKTALEPQRTPTVLTETFRVSGMAKFRENIISLSRVNPDWQLNPDEIILQGKAGQKIYQRKFINSPVQLVPDSNSTQDPNAVAVMIGDLTVGYVPKDISAKINFILQEKEIKKIACGIFGGPYKVVYDDSNITTDKSPVSIAIRVSYVSYESASTQSVGNARRKGRVKLAEVLLACLLGCFGAHKFYRKKFGMGLLYLLTFGLLGIGWIGDAIYLTIQYLGQKSGNVTTTKQKVASYLIPAAFIMLCASCGNTTEEEANPTTEDYQIVETASASEYLLPSTEPLPVPPEESIATSESTAPEITETKQATIPSTSPATEAITAIVTTQPPETEEYQFTYVLNTNTEKFHYSSCSSAKKIKEKNRSSFTGTRDEVIARGYEPCGICHP